MKRVTPGTLPEPSIKAYGAWVLLMVEPMEQPSELIEVVHSKYDEGSAPGIAWVLSASKGYYDQNPHKEQKKAPSYEDKKYWCEMPVQRGDKVLFRRFYRSQGLMQGKSVELEQVSRDFPDYETFFIHVNDIYGTLEYDGRDDKSPAESADTQIPEGLPEGLGRSRGSRHDGNPTAVSARGIRETDNQGE